MKRCPVLIFAKAAVSGQVKTRLIPAYGRTGANRIYRKMLHKTIITAKAASIGPVYLFASPDKKQPYFRHIRHFYGIQTVSQKGKDLGERMFNAFSKVQKMYTAAIIIGCDCPHLTPAGIRQASAKILAGKISTGEATQKIRHNVHQFVFIKAKDGGYVLIGAKQMFPSIYQAIFRDICWGTDSVMEITEKRLLVAKIPYFCFPPLQDIDLPQDVKRINIKA